MLLIALIAPWAANAQNRTLVTIGDGTSTQRYPLPGYYGYQYEGGYSDHLPILLDFDVYF